MQESANSALQQVPRWLFIFDRLEMQIKDLGFYPTTRKPLFVTFSINSSSPKTSKPFRNFVGITFHPYRCGKLFITFHPYRCGKDICKKKQPTPQKKVNKLFCSSVVFFIFYLVCYTLIVASICKIYREKTIEVGVYIDRHVYKNMEEVFNVISVLYLSYIHLL